MITERYIAGTDEKDGEASRRLAGGQSGSDTQEGIFGKLLAAVAALAPMGYEDETGFHYGTEPHPVRWWKR